MIKLSPLTTMGLLALLLFIGCTTSDKSSTDNSKPATPEELSQMNRDFVKALNAKDAVAAANCYTEDATILPPMKLLLKGEQTFKSIGREQLQQEHLTQKLLQQKRVVTETWAMKLDDYK